MKPRVVVFYLSCPTMFKLCWYPLDIFDKFFFRAQGPTVEKCWSACVAVVFSFTVETENVHPVLNLYVEVVCKTKILRHMNMNGRKWSMQMWGQRFEIAIYWHYRLLIIKYLIVKLLFDNNNIVFEININILSNSSWYKHVWYVHQCSRFYTKQRVSVKGFSIYMYTKNNSVLNLKKNLRQWVKAVSRGRVLESALEKRPCENIFSLTLRMVFKSGW